MSTQSGWRGWLRKLVGPCDTANETAPASSSAVPPAPVPEAEAAKVTPKSDEPFRLLEVAEYDAQDRRPLGADVLVGREGVTELVRSHFGESLAQLPAFPLLATEIFDAVRRPDAQINEVVSLIGRDPVISAHVLKVANSAFSSALEPIRSLRDAVMRIGLKETANVAAIALSGPLFDPEVTSVQEAFRPLWDRLWRHSIVSGSAAGQLAVEWHKGDPMRIFLAGILHDIGKTFVLRSLGALIVAGRVEALSGDVIEYLLESLHQEMGVQAARAWHLPDFIVSACENHHQPDLPGTREWEDLHMLRLVSGIDEIRLNPFFHHTLPNELYQSIKALQLQPKHLRVVAGAVREQSQKNPALQRTAGG